MPAPRPSQPAADELLRQLREPVHSLCMHLTGRREDAEEALREAFVAVRRGLPSHRGASRPTTWVYRIALRAALRERARRRRGEGPDGAPASLPAGPGAVLALFAVEGLSPSEIADVLGIPEAAVWPRLHAARRMVVESKGR